MRFELPAYVKNCINTIEQNGYEAWCIGGAVRDMVMGKIPHDYDVATSADCHTVADMFEKSILTGEKHGTVTIIIEGNPIEVTTYRTDGEYLNNRAPETGHFVKNIEEDIKRRDFTVNALAYHPARGILDITGGVNDINATLLQTVGEPAARFSEDALRIMRLFRFAAQLKFLVEEKTLKAALKLAQNLETISIERIYAELSKLIVTSGAAALNPLLENGLLEFCGIGRCSLNQKFEALPPYLPLRIAVLSTKCGAEPLPLLKRLKADNKTAQKAQTIFEILSADVPNDIVNFKRIFGALSPAEWEYIRQTAEILKGGNYAFITEFVNIITTNHHPYTVSQLEIKGDDIIKLGAHGKQVGELLGSALEICLENPQYNTKPYLTEFIKLKLNNH